MGGASRRRHPLPLDRATGRHCFRGAVLLRRSRRTPTPGVATPLSHATPSRPSSSSSAACLFSLPSFGWPLEFLRQEFRSTRRTRSAMFRKPVRSCSPFFHFGVVWQVKTNV